MNPRSLLRRLTAAPRPGLLVLRQSWRGDRAGTAQVIVISLLVGILPAGQVTLTAAFATALLRAAGSPHPQLRGVLFYLVLLAALGLGSQLLILLQNRAMQRCQSRLSAHLSEEIISRASRFTLSQVEDPKIQDSLQRAVREVGFRPGMMLSQLVQTTTQMVAFGSVGVILWTLDFRVALLAMLAPVPTVVAQILQGKRAHALEHGRSEERRRLAYWQHLASQPNSMKEVLAFRLSPVVLSNHRRLLAGIVGADLRLANRNLRLSIPMVILTAALTISAQAVAILGGTDARHVAGLLAVIQAIGMLQSSAQILYGAVSGMYVNQLYLRNVNDFLAIEHTPLPQGELTFPQRISKGIEFRDVSFSYPGSARPALENVSFTLKPGQVTAVVGLNGAGKSTLGKLLGRLYEPTEGSILVDGVPLAGHRLDSLRDRVSYVFQNYVEYQLSVGENISLGLEHEAGREHAAGRKTDRVEAAAREVGMHEHIASLPQGYGTQAGKLFTGGVEFSGGQWQRLAIARGMVRSACVRVMDEPTAALDTITEAELLDTLTTATSGRVSLLIAHRFSSVLRADRVLVFDRGRLVEDGDHHELMRLGGLYARMYEAQTAGHAPTAGAGTGARG
ncbi:ABC transporter ATP-binding protein [Streptomyces triculaminicus]|uniref:ABC transporter ATP-binding protein n=2 Tax=Streptomyces TaxID=1883 RepID=A0A939FTQ2_9ACTN|nr:MULTISPECIES: ABC transporter ATP-binding protein [Streptomyces]MBO0655807.1 ABC transporter ATP-binding protein [Streptomyces triculaminicus]QSY49826.1 ABC transporter ATP-binding protein [Streptomyces griseocarneus]